MSTTNISMCPAWCTVDHADRESRWRWNFEHQIKVGLARNTFENRRDVELVIMEGWAMHESDEDGQLLASIATVDPETGSARVVINPELLERDLTPDDARNLAAALIDAANQLEGTHD